MKKRKQPRPHSGSYARKVFIQLRAKNLILATAESCTGGRIAAAMTAVSGASDIYWGGWITYQGVAKQKALGLTQKQTQNTQIVSASTAATMARGALMRSDCAVALAITGWAGKSAGATQPRTQPPGLAYLAIAVRGRRTARIRLQVPSRLSRAQKQKRFTALALKHLDQILKRI